MVGSIGSEKPEYIQYKLSFRGYVHFSIKLPNVELNMLFWSSENRSQIGREINLYRLSGMMVKENMRHEKKNQERDLEIFREREAWDRELETLEQCEKKILKWCHENHKRMISLIQGRFQEKRRANNVEYNREIEQKG